MNKTLREEKEEKEKEKEKGGICTKCKPNFQPTLLYFRQPWNPMLGRAVTVSSIRTITMQLILFFM